jgi:hypothetical protein
MRTVVITVATKEDEGLDRLKYSLERKGIDLVILGKKSRWKGFGTKIILLQQYLKLLAGYTHFIFVDAYDVIFLDGLENIEKIYDARFQDQIVFSTEKNCWPDPTLANSYPENESLYKYLNSGSYMAPIEKFLNLLKEYSVGYADDDQLFFTNVFLKGNITLDYNCEIFQCYSFIAEGEFEYKSGRLINKNTGTEPSIIHGNGRTDMTKIIDLLDDEYNSIDEVIKLWQPTEQYNVKTNDVFKKKVNNSPELKAHRDWVEQNAWGFGERSFQWMWKLLVDKMPEHFVFLEIGVFRGQILSLIGMLANLAGKSVMRYGVTPLSPAEINWESDYEADIRKIHDQFNIWADYIILKGDSTDPKVIESASGLLLDILYIDGCHAKSCVQSDIINYGPLLKVGGYLVIDDSACKFPMPWGYFRGIQSVCDGVDELLPPGINHDQYEHLFNIVHNRVWRKIK